MKANVGDWLIVESREEGHPARRGEIVAVRHEDGSPPFTVRWTDDDHEGLVFPGPDARVLTTAELADHDRVHSG